MRAFEIWPVAASLGMTQWTHRERQSIHPYERVYRAVKAWPRILPDQAFYDYETFCRPHWYGKRMPHGGEDPAADLCAMVRELWLAGAVSLVWALRAAESLRAVDPEHREVRHTIALLRRLVQERARKRGGR